MMELKAGGHQEVIHTITIWKWAVRYLANYQFLALQIPKGMKNEQLVVKNVTRLHVMAQMLKNVTMPPNGTGGQSTIRT